MNKELEIYKEIGFFVCKYRLFCKSVSSNCLVPVEWDTKKIEEVFNIEVINQMNIDEKYITNLIKSNKSVDLYIGQEFIMNLAKKYECV
jgi:hypothetical protein